MRWNHEMLGLVFRTVHVTLATNALLAVACLPLLVVLVSTDPARSWPLLALLAPLCAPALCAAFAVLAADETRGTVVTFLRAWRATARRAITVGAGASAALVVLGVDTRAAWSRPIGALVVPMLVVSMLLVVATALLLLVVLAGQPTARLRDAVRRCAYLAVRRWYLTLFSLAVLALLEALFASRPALAAGLAAAPLLFVVQANSRFTLAPAPTKGAS